LLELWFLRAPIQLGVPVASLGPHSLPFPAVCPVMIAGALARGRSLRLVDAAVGAMLVLNLVVLVWADPGWDVSATELEELRSVAESDRPHVRVGNQIYEPDFMRVRDDNLGPGDLVVFNDDIAFVSNLWTSAWTTTSSTSAITGREDFVARIHELHAPWVASAKAARRTRRSDHPTAATTSS